MNLVQKIIPVFLLCLFILPVSVLAQEEDQRLIKTKKFRELELKRAVEQAEKLSKGVLVVRLTSNSRKIKALESLVRDNPSSKRYRKQLRKTKSKILALQKATITAYTNYYTFSEVYFIMDTDVKKLVKGTKKGIFINQYFEKDSTIDITGRDFFISHVGYPSAGTSTRSLLIKDSKNHLVPKPFPFSTLFATPRDKILVRPDHDIIIEAVERQQETLDKFYTKGKSKLNE